MSRAEERVCELPRQLRVQRWISPDAEIVVEVRAAKRTHVAATPDRFSCALHALSRVHARSCTRRAAAKVADLAFRHLRASRFGHRTPTGQRGCQVPRRCSLPKLSGCRLIHLWATVPARRHSDRGKRALQCLQANDDRIKTRNEVLLSRSKTDAPHENRRGRGAIRILKSRETCVVGDARRHKGCRVPKLNARIA